jgi:chromate transporter
MAQAGGDRASGAEDGPAGRQPVSAVFRAFLVLGFTAFGGPVAHLGYFREAFVERRRWLDERAYADLVALCQFLPGPASSQVGIGIGLAKAGLPGALAAWAAFTAPSALALILFGYGVAALGEAAPPGLLQGLKVAAVAVVANAVWGMARALTPDAPRMTLAALAAIFVLAIPGPLAQLGAIVAGGLAGLALLRPAGRPGEGAAALGVAVPRPLALGCLAAFLALLAGLPLLAGAADSQGLALFDAFYRAGSLVFGGGHVVLPLLQSEVIPPGWVTEDAFLAGYGAAQAVPGPLFTFSAYLGAVADPAPNGLLGGLICLLAIFLPSFLLVTGILPFYEALRARPGVQRALAGVNAAVVGLLLAALYRPVWTSAILGPADFALGLAAFVLLAFWKLPPWLVVLLSAAGGVGIAAAAGAR